MDDYGEIGEMLGRFYSSGVQCSPESPMLKAVDLFYLALQQHDQVLF